MNTVQPIKDKNKIKGMYDVLLNNSGENGERNALMFECGIYLGLRISDIIQLQVQDVRDKEGINLKETKRGKVRMMKFNPKFKESLDKYIEGKPDNEYLFGSRERADYITTTTRKKDPKTGRMKNVKKKIRNRAPNSPISRQAAWGILNKAAKQVGLENIGTHSLRKTFGYTIYNQDPTQLPLLQEIFGHSSQATTLRYIGIVQEDIDDAVCSIDYGF